jgi:hypothetical protein
MDTKASSSLTPDPEKSAGDYAHLTNDTIRTFGWEAASVSVKDRTTKQPKAILSGVNGLVKAGEMLAIMGPRSVLPTLSSAPTRE